jgi:hypothetical protein
VSALSCPLPDNNLEAPIRDDLTEITKSQWVNHPSMVTWVYFDARNLGTDEDIFEPLENVFNADGTPLTEKFEGSRYIRWDHDQEKMVVETTILEGEQDSDSGLVLQSFLVHALSDCVARGTNEYFLALSSHGGGYAGFGADDHERRRRLGYQSNDSIRNAVQTALASVAGAPSLLDVLGFDACLMNSMGALDEYKDITKYYLASEATEPGHGTYNWCAFPKITSPTHLYYVLAADRLGVQ